MPIFRFTNDSFFLQLVSAMSVIINSKTDNFRDYVQFSNANI